MRKLNWKGSKKALKDGSEVQKKAEENGVPHIAKNVKIKNTEIPIKEKYCPFTKKGQIIKWILREVIRNRQKSTKLKKQKTR